MNPIKKHIIKKVIQHKLKKAEKKIKKAVKRLAS